MQGSLSQYLAGYLLLNLIVFIPAVLAVWLLRTRWLVHLPPEAPPRRGGVVRGALVGGLSALGIVGVSVGVAWLAGAYSPGLGFEPFSYAWGAESWTTGMLPVMLLLAAINEEVLFRVLALGLLAMLLLWITELVLYPLESRRYGSRKPRIQPDPHLIQRSRLWFIGGAVAVLVTGIAFGIAHSSNPEISATAVINIALAGIWLGWLYWREGNVLGVFAAHFIWNLVLTLLGLPVSGVAFAPSALGPDGARAGILSGGSFGPEASLPCTIALLAVIGWLIWQDWRWLTSVAEPKAIETEEPLEAV